MPCVNTLHDSDCPGRSSDCAGRTMKLTHHEVLEFSRCAAALYRRGCNEQGHLLSVVAAIGPSSTEQYDRAAAIYRAWLVGT